VDGFATDAKSFFGAGGATAPAGIGSPLDGGLSATGPESGLLLERRITLEPGEQRTLYFLYGYPPAGTEAAALVAKYRGSKTTAWKDSSRQSKEKGMRFETKAEPWVKPETAWHYYYLRSSLTYDAFFGEHILSQGGIYQYTMGFQGAARDPLQHALPFLFSDPQIVKEVLRYTLKEVRADGSIPSPRSPKGLLFRAPQPRKLHVERVDSFGGGFLWLGGWGHGLGRCRQERTAGSLVAAVGFAAAGA
jgi:cellobiose phosphorylase